MNKILCILLLVLAQPFARSQEEPHPPGMLGVHLHEVYPEDVDRLQLPGQYGAVVDEVSPGSAAELAGIKPFDVIHTFHGHRVASARALQRMVRETPAGRPVEMGLFRGGEVLTLNVTLQEAPRMEPPMLEDEEPDLSPDDLAEMLRNHPWIVRQAQGRRLGATVQGVQPQLAAYLHLAPGHGLLVMDVQPDSPAAKAGIQRSDVLVTVNEVPVTTTRELAAQLDSLVGNEVKLDVMRAGKSVQITVRFAPVGSEDGESL